MQVDVDGCLIDLNPGENSQPASQKWISVKDRYPEHRQNVKIRVKDTEAKEHELECTFNDYEDYRGWEIKPPENVNIHAKPTHWMPLPKPPKE